MNSLPVLFCFVFSLSSCLPRASRKEEKSKAVGGKKKKKPEHCISHHSEASMEGGPKALGSQDLEQGTKGSG